MSSRRDNFGKLVKAITEELVELFADEEELILRCTKCFQWLTNFALIRFLDIFSRRLICKDYFLHIKMKKGAIQLIAVSEVLSYNK